MLSTLLLYNYYVHKDRSSRMCQKNVEIRPIEFLRMIDRKYFENIRFYNSEIFVDRILRGTIDFMELWLFPISKLKPFFTDSTKQNSNLVYIPKTWFTQLCDWTISQMSLRSSTSNYCIIVINFAHISNSW